MRARNYIREKVAKAHGGARGARDAVGAVVRAARGQEERGVAGAVREGQGGAMKAELSEKYVAGTKPAATMSCLELQDARGVCEVW